MQNIKGLTKKTKTRYMSRTNMLKSSNFTMDLTTLEARSYDWWIFVRRVHGKVVINKTSYSNSTSKHQNKALSVLEYKYDLKLRFTRKSLSDLPAALDNEVQNAKLEIGALIKAIKKPKTRKSTNNERRATIQGLIHHIDTVRKFKSELKGE
jgi:hypothetical protein